MGKQGYVIAFKCVNEFWYSVQNNSTFFFASGLAMSEKRL